MNIRKKDMKETRNNIKMVKKNKLRKGKKRRRRRRKKKKRKRSNLKRDEIKGGGKSIEKSEEKTYERM